MSTTLVVWLTLVVAFPMVMLFIILAVAVRTTRMVHRMRTEQLYATMSARTKADRLEGEVVELKRCHAEALVEAEERGRASTEIIAAERLLAMLEHSKQIEIRVRAGGVPTLPTESQPPA